MNTWAPLWIGLVDSSIWEEPDHVFRVFIALMSLKDSCHMVSFDAYKLHRRIHMPIEQVEDALKVLSEPDKRRPGQADEGRRIRPVEGGWEIINGEKYLCMVQEEMRLTRQRRGSANYRARKAGRPIPFPKEDAAYKKSLNGKQGRNAEQSITASANGESGQINRARRGPPSEHGPFADPDGEPTEREE